MYKFFKNRQANRENDLPAFNFRGRPLLPAVSALLYAKGITDGGAARAYLDPSAEDLQDALLLANIERAADRIKVAVGKGESILIYGDYDADGICAAAVLYSYLKGQGAVVIPYIPDRENGYGLSVPVIESIAEEYGPDLWLTCDCGISNAGEAAYILDLGMDVIITDHHDLPDALPDCITVNPKLEGQGYDYPYLCGAGVALMLVWAMGGKEAAMPYLGCAAVATIGDMVPLTGQNRIITKLGLKQLNGAPPLWLKMLAEACGLAFPLTAQDIAFKIVPRINAAGRMARAADAFDFIVSADPAEKRESLKKIEEAAALRKAASDKLYSEALADLREERLYESYAIVLSSPEWEKGVTGIAAAQLAGTFNRPVFLMAKGTGDEYKGTARGIDGVNVREVLAAVSRHLTEYGGHAGAAGFSLPEKNIPLFKKAVISYIGANTDKALFSYRQGYDAEISEDEITLELARQLKLFEPFGTENSPPLFRLRTEKASVTAMKNKPGHITVCTEKGVNILGFNCHKLSDILRSRSCKELLIEIRTSAYMGREELSAVLRHSSCAVFGDDIDDQKIAARYINPIALPHPPVQGLADVKVYAAGELETLIKSRSPGPYGLLVIASCYASYRAFADKFDPCGEVFLHEYLHPVTQNNYNRLIIAPDMSEFDMGLYHTAVFLDAPFDKETTASLAAFGAQIYIPEGEASAAVKNLFKTTDLSRECFGKFYRLLSALEGTTAQSAEALFGVASKRDTSIVFSQFMICLYVFTELRLVEYGDNMPLKLLPGKAGLTDSKIYRGVLELTRDD